MTPDIQELKQRLDHLERLFFEMHRPDVYRFERPLKPGANALRIGNTTNDKIGFHNKTGVVQQGPIGSTSGGATVDGIARGCIEDIRTILVNYGLSSG